MNKKDTLQEYGELTYALGHLRGYFRCTDFMKTEPLIESIQLLETYIVRQFIGGKKDD